jgi:hypothetical protein
MRRVVVCLVLAALVAVPGFAQSIVGRISGTVVDTSGAVIPGATVNITNEATKLTRALKTDANGFYVATALPVGNYTVQVEHAGFKKQAKSGANLVADGRLTVDFALPVGEMSSTVEVIDAAGETVNTVSGEVGRVIDSEQVQNLALNGRNYMQLVSLIPGAALLDEDQLALTTSLSITAQAVNGNRGNTNYLSVDGGSNMDSGSNGSQVNNVGIDFIREVNIKSSNFSAEFGRNSGSSINVVTRGGADQFHGGALEFFRNDKLDAKNYFAPIKGPLRYNDFGWNLGGPIKRGKIFFFAGQEWKRIRKLTDPVRRTVPTNAELAGDFSRRSGNLYYPGTTQPVPDRNIKSLIVADGRAVANAYNRMKEISSLYTDTTTGNNVTHQATNPFNWRQDIVRLDYKVNDTNNIYFRRLHDNYDLIEPYGTFFSSNLPMTPTKRNRPGYGYQLSHTWMPRGNMVNEAKINASWNGQRIPMVGDDWTRNKYGFVFPQIFKGSGWYEVDGMPNIDVAGFANLRGPNQALISPTTDVQMMETFTYIKGRHTAKFGLSYIRNRKDQNVRSEYSGYINYSADSGNRNSTGNSVADALLGNFRTYREASADPVGFFRFYSIEGFATDSWKITRKLSLEFGMRWQRNVPTFTQANNITNFIPGNYDPKQAVQVTNAGIIVPNSGNQFNGLIRAGGGVPESELPRLIGTNVDALQRIPAGAARGLYDPQLLFAPRFSFAYAPFHNNNTAIRGGFGVFYDKPEGNLIFPLLNYAPWLQSVTYDSGNISNPGGGTAAALSPLGSVDAIDPKLKTPYTMSWSFGIQQQLPKGFFMETSYVANVGRHLIRQPDINQVPFTTLAASRNIPTAQRPADNSMRPYLGFSNIRQRMSDSTSNYHSLQAYAARRKGRLMMTTSYTFSKVLTDASGNGDNPENPYNRHYNYGPASFDRNHILVVTYTYQIPMHRFQNVAMKKAFMGWEFSGITRVQTGQAYSITANTSIGGRRADYLGGDVLMPEDERGPNKWFNPNAFGPAPNDRLGNLGAGVARGPGLYLWDFSLRKQFTFGKDGKKRIQFQADGFNIMNHVNFRGPNTNRSDVNFGTISSAGPGRNIQFGLKFNF